MTKKFVPEKFEVPQTLENEKFRLRMLTINDVVKDYDAVMSSIDHLKGVFGGKYNWPRNDLTIEENLIGLGWHQKEFERKSSFTYIVMTLDEAKCLGCVYIFPASRGNFDAEIYLWVRKRELENGLDDILFSTVKNWIKTKWPFNKVAYPGRKINWDEWKSLE